MSSEMQLLSLASIRRKSPKYQTSTKPKAQTPVNISQRRRGRRSLGKSLSRAWTAICVLLGLADGALVCGIVTQPRGGFKMDEGGPYKFATIWHLHPIRRRG